MAYRTEIKEQLDPRLLQWPGVTSREMFGAICYLVQDKMFAIVTQDSVATKLPEHERQEAISKHGASEFVVSSGRPFGEWTQFPAADPNELDSVMPWVNKGYDYVQSTLSSRRPSKRRTKRRSLGDATG